MNTTQLQEIRQYLLSKKLPIDILIEVNDHFISQIYDLQKEKNLTFEEAFERVKLKWGTDFILVRRHFFSTKRTPKIIYETEKQLSKDLLLKSFYIASVMIFLEIISSRFFRNGFHPIYLNLMLFSMFTYPFLLMVLYSKQQTLLFKNKRKNVVVNYYLHPIIALIIGLILNYMGNFPKEQENHLLDFLINPEAFKNVGIFLWKTTNKILAFSFFTYTFLCLYKNIIKLKKTNKIQFS